MTQKKKKENLLYQGSSKNICIKQQIYGQKKKIKQKYIFLYTGDVKINENSSDIIKMENIINA